MTTLPSTINSPTIEKRIMTAARKRFHKRKGIDLFFEHGHWWLRLIGVGEDSEDRTFDVVDAEGGESINGFDFEEIG